MDKELTIELSEEQMAHFVSNGSLTIILKQTIKMTRTDAMKAIYTESPKKKEPKEDPKKIAREEKIKAQEKKERLVAEYLTLPENVYLNDLDWNKCVKYLNDKEVKIKRSDKIILSSPDDKHTVLWEELITGKSIQKNKNKKDKPYSKQQQKLVDAFTAKYPKALKKSEKQTHYEYNESSFRNSVFAHLQAATKAATDANESALMINSKDNQPTSNQLIGAKWYDDIVEKIVNEQGEGLEYDDEKLLKEAQSAVTEYIAAKKADSNWFLISANSTMYIIRDGYPEVATDTYDEIVN